MYIVANIFLPGWQQNTSLESVFKALSRNTSLSPWSCKKPDTNLPFSKTIFMLLDSAAVTKSETKFIEVHEFKASA